jgi:hypothetical protein
MLDDVRSPSAALSAEERSWQDMKPASLMTRVCAAAAIAVAVGVSVSHLLGADSAITAGVVIATP